MVWIFNWLRPSRDPEDGFRTGCRNISHKQQSFSGLQSPRWSFSTNVQHRNVINIYKPPINFCGLSLDKTDHVIQNWTVVIRGYQRPIWYPASIWFFVYRRKTKTCANLWAELLIIRSWSWKTRETVLQKPGMEKLKSGWAMWYQRTQKIHKICRNDLSVLTLRINRRVIK